MAAALDAGYTQATDLSEFIVQSCGVDYRSAYEVVGWTVRDASSRGIPGGITGAMLDEAAIAETGGLGTGRRDLDGGARPAADHRDKGHRRGGPDGGRIHDQPM